MIYPKETDRVFYDSPDTGHPTCMCSRCGNQIREQEIALRFWPAEPGDIGFDPAAKGGTEFRFCQKCCEAEGMIFGSQPDEEDNEIHTNQ